MRTVVLVVVVAVMAAAPALAQEAAAEVQRTAQQEEWFQRMDMLKQMGMNDEEALFFSMLTSGDLDATQMMLLMAMMDGGGNMDDALGMMMFMNAMGSGDGAKPPVVLDRGQTLLILQDGVLYKINLEEMALAGSLAYAKGGGMDDLLPLLQLIAAWRQERPQAQVEPAEVAQVDMGPAMEPRLAECRNNGRQLGLALQMYVEDAGGVLPGEDWAKKLFAYAVNDRVFMCPLRPDLAVAYAMNEKLVGARLADIADRGQAVVFFESNLGGENPVGGPEAVPEQGVHDGLVNLVFVDGHCNSVPPDEAKELLGEAVLEQ